MVTTEADLLFQPDGGTLYEFLHRQDPIPWSVRLNVALDIAKGTHSMHIKKSYFNIALLGMDFLHSASPPIIHRDLKSVNILVPPLSFLFFLRISLRKKYVVADAKYPDWLHCQDQ